MHIRKRLEWNLEDRMLRYKGSKQEVRKYDLKKSASKTKMMQTAEMFKSSNL